MRVLGWCTKCRKSKVVRVRVADLDLKNNPAGICADCEFLEVKK